MSRSYKKTPRWGDTKDKFFKKYANHKLRQLPIDEPLLNHKSYKKNFCMYDICDYETVGISFQDYWSSVLQSWYNWRWQYEPYPDYEEAYKEYQKWFIRK